jgi:hypothetical protein
MKPAMLFIVGIMENAIFIKFFGHGTLRRIPKSFTNIQI